MHCIAYGRIYCALLTRRYLWSINLPAATVSHEVLGSAVHMAGTDGVVVKIL